MTGNDPVRAILAVGLGVVLLGSATPLGAQQPFPYRLRSGVDLPLTVGGVAMLGGAFAVGSGQEPLTPAEIAALDPSQVNAFDRGATHQWSPGARTSSNIVIAPLLLAPVALMLTPPGSHEGLTLAAMYGEALLLSNGLTTLIKTAASRTRPYVYNDDPDIPPEDRESLHARRSFPSGHASMAFTSAVFLGTVYSTLHPNSSLRPWIWAGGLVGAGAVSYLRYEAGQHYPTDVLVGGALGVLTGWVVPQLHRRSDIQVSLVPTEAGSLLLVTLPGLSGY